MNERPRTRHTYQNVVFDSSRWAGFRPRDDDVIVCTSYKAGTTWTQMICALLIHRSPDFPAPLGALAPWLDMRAAPIDSILAGFEAQTHRRLIKTHTALDGLPYFDNVTYLVCGRDPRDVFMSLQNHLANADAEQAMKLFVAGGADLSQPPPALPDDINERFRIWLTQGTFEWEQDGLPFWSHFHHAKTFWRRRTTPNIHFLHYADLKADLAGEMRRVAGLLGIEIDEAAWPALVKAASFEDMKANADRTAPDAQHRMWRSNSQFFNKGENEQWRGVLSEDSLNLYEKTTRARYDPALLFWLEEGARMAGDPKTS